MKLPVMSLLLAMTRLPRATCFLAAPAASLSRGYRHQAGPRAEQSLRMVSAIDNGARGTSSTSAAPAAAAGAAGGVKSAQSLAKEIFATDKRPVILFDGVCNWCNTWVNLALDMDPKRELRFSPLQSDASKALLQERCGRSPDDISSIVYVDETDFALKSDAILKIGDVLQGPVPFFSKVGGALVPRFIRDRAYDVVADNRYRFMGKRDECRVPDQEDIDRFV